VFFAYIGFDAVTTLAAEVKNPKRDMPIGIVGTLLIATLMYMGVSLGTLSYAFKIFSTVKITHIILVFSFFFFFFYSVSGLLFRFDF
jgi:amino acid transporter